MFKGHPRGLFIASLANMGERFGFYTMIAIFTLFIQAKYGFDAAKTSHIYSYFLVAVYFLPLIGGIIADRWLGYGRTVTLGIVIMFIGYLLLAFPSKYGTGLFSIYIALGVISFGTGLFKGNLQALVGNLYDDPKYSAKRDSAFNIFYMCINIGAMFAPTAAEAVNNFILKASNYTYDGRIPAMAHKFINGTLSAPEEYLSIAQIQDPAVTLDSLRIFSENYLNQLSQSYHYGFGVACISLIISMAIFLGFRKHYRHADVTESKKIKNNDKTAAIELTPAQFKERIIALLLVFGVVIFFWMAFHQNAASMTYFARDYTATSVGKFTNIFFDLFTLLSVFFAVLGLIFVFRKKSSSTVRLIGGIAFVAFAAIAVYRFWSFQETNPFTPQMFQHFNPFLIVVLTPVVIAFFGWLNRKGKEPSAPKKIGIGMVITGIAFILLVIASIGLPSPKSLGGLAAPDASRVSTYWLISTYLILTIAELFLSPMGISFVSKVAPPKLKGLMQGGWLAATALGNYLMGVAAGLWDFLPLWMLWSIFVVCCLLAATFIFSILKRLERATAG
ncbi:MAG: peptide MFS transporter [Bacteroidales bacterium]|nr:peptide MFS transporter [Bacteroidales bacterium]